MQKLRFKVNSNECYSQSHSKPWLPRSFAFNNTSDHSCCGGCKAGRSLCHLLISMAVRVRSNSMAASGVRISPESGPSIRVWTSPWPLSCTKCAANMPLSWRDKVILIFSVGTEGNSIAALSVLCQGCILELASKFTYRESSIDSLGREVLPGGTHQGDHRCSLDLSPTQAASDAIQGVQIAVGVRFTCWKAWENSGP
jgi:hypothetical protein